MTVSRTIFGRFPTSGWLALWLLSAACGGDELPTAETLEKVGSTDGQSTPAGGFLPAPLAVVVKAADGSPVPRAEVRWSVSSGTGAVLSDSVTLSDGDGRAEVMVRLGPTAGSYGVRAALKAREDRRVSFSLTATEPPVLSAMTPADFRGGDTIRLSGSNLGPEAQAFIGGHPARIVGSSGGTSISVVAPPCLVPGAVKVRVEIRSASSNELSGNYQASTAPVRLAVGDYASLVPASVAGCAVFPPAGLDTVEYLITPQAVSGKAGDSTTYRLRGDSVATVTTKLGIEGQELPFAVVFHDALRQREAEMAGLPRPAFEPSAAPAASPPGIGSRRTFRVCNKLDCNKSEDFSTVLAEVHYVGERAVIYQDVEAPPGGFTSEDFRQLGALFDQELYGVATRAFGAESDVDRNGVIFVLFTPVVNRLTPKEQCSQAFVTGFFFSIDIDPAFARDERSNKAEVFYAIVPDSAGTVTCQHRVSSVKRFVPVTFIHEFQHMISFYQHVMLRGGRSAEELWLNEAMSHLAEELGGFHFLALGDQRKFSDFVIGNLFNAYKYLQDPGARFVFPKAGQGTLEERGAAWLFLRWIVDQFGDEVVRRLSETSLTGVANVERATGEPIERLLAQWFLANWVSDLPGFSPQPRLKYRKWSFRSVYRSLHTQSPTNFPRPFPLVPDSFFGGQFQVSGVLRAGSGEYVRVIQLPSQKGFALQFTDGLGAPLTGVPARLNIIRVK
ncbi:MAG: hypothetical protein KatS3mg081_1167 [Gemmatimonadales bacterium]|nr:MAG: hypothetical protein KatS3mg081_1167 [Gemmatimonadales bacterium]